VFFSQLQAQSAMSEARVQFVEALSQHLARAHNCFRWVLARLAWEVAAAAAVAVAVVGWCCCPSLDAPPMGGALWSHILAALAAAQAVVFALGFALERANLERATAPAVAARTLAVAAVVVPLPGRRTAAAVDCAGSRRTSLHPNGAIVQQ